MVCFVAGEGLDAVVEACRHLEDLHLQATSLSDTHIHAADWNASKLRNLHVSWCRNVTEAGFASMICNLKYLEKLQICSCGNGLAITDGLARKLARSRPRFLKELNFRYENYNSDGKCKFDSVTWPVQNATGPRLFLSMYTSKLRNVQLGEICAGQKIFSTKFKEVFFVLMTNVRICKMRVFKKFSQR